MLCKYTCLYIYTRVHVAHTSPTVFPARHVTPLREFSRAPCHGRILTAPFFLCTGRTPHGSSLPWRAPDARDGPRKSSTPLFPICGDPIPPICQKK